MQRLMRLLLYFAVGVTFGACAVVASAAITPYGQITSRPYSGGETAWQGCAPQQASAGACAARVVEAMQNNFPASGCVAGGTTDEQITSTSHSMKVIVDATAPIFTAGGCSAGANIFAYWASCPAGTTVTSGNYATCTDNSASCPPNSTASGGSCVCNTGYTESGSTCVVQACPNAGTEAAFPCSGAGCSGLSTPMCSGGCTYNKVNSISGPSLAGTLYVKAAGPTSTCTSPTNLMQDATAPTAPLTCPAGQCTGSVNGASVCVACSQSAAANTSSSYTSSSGSGSASAPAPSSTVTTTNKSVSCDTAGCTTTTTTTTTAYDGSGNPGTPQVTTTTGASRTPGDNEVGQFCKENPDAPMCKPSGFGGSCPAAFSCTGDAAQCAIAKATNELNCTMKQESEQATLFNQVAAGEDPLKAEFPTDPSKVTVAGAFGSGSIEQTSWLGSGGMQDKTVSIGSMGSVTIPFSHANPVLNMMGVIVVAFSLIAAARIVGVF